MQIKQKFKKNSYRKIIRFREKTTPMSMQCDYTRLNIHKILNNMQMSLKIPYDRASVSFINCTLNQIKLKWLNQERWSKDI